MLQLEAIGLMSLFRFIVVLCVALSAGTFFVAALVSPQAVAMSTSCLDCIAQSLSNSSYAGKCYGDVCGLFCIKIEYWEDAGKETLTPDENPDSIDAYPNCACDRSCSENVVRNYMSRFAQDCNNDGTIDCIDYALIHWLGPYHCNVNLNNDFMNKFMDCHKLMAQDLTFTQY